MKTCIECGEDKTLDCFAENRRKCKDCRRGYIIAWREVNQEEQNAKKRAKYANDPEPAKAMARMWYENNRERALANMRRWEQNNPEIVKVHRKNTKAKRRSAAIVADLTPEQWMSIWNEFDGLCFWCGGEATDLDHIVPLVPRAGGLQGHHTMGNVVPSCGPCNKKKTNKDPLVFLQEVRDGRRS